MASHHRRGDFTNDNLVRVIDAAAPRVQGRGCSRPSGNAPSTPSSSVDCRQDAHAYAQLAASRGRGGTRASACCSRGLLPPPTLCWSVARGPADAVGGGIMPTSSHQQPNTWALTRMNDGGTADGFHRPRMEAAFADAPPADTRAVHSKRSTLMTSAT